MQFKKLAAITGSALMAGLALAGPALAASVTKLSNISDLVSVTDSTVSFPLFVIGANAATSDVAGAVDVAVNMASLAKTTKDVTTTGGVGETVTGGAAIATTGIRLTPWTNLQGIKSIFTASDIPELLGTNTFSSGTGASYEYKQYLYLLGEDTNAAGAQVQFTRPTDENAPRMAFKIPIAQVLYTHKLTFSTPVSLTGVTTTGTLQGVIQGMTINILGKDFVISDCAYGTGAAVISSMTLLGGKNVVTVESGSPETVTVGTKDYTVTLSSVASEVVGSTTYYTAIGDVNGEAFSLRAGQSTPLADKTLIAAIKVFQGKTGAADYLKLAIGADKVKLSSAGTVTIGDKTSPALSSSITSTNTTGWSAVAYNYTPSAYNWLAVGESVTDPFASAFDIKFNSISSPFDDATSRQTISLIPSGYNMLLTYKNAGDAEKQLYTLYYNSTAWKWASAQNLGISATYADNQDRDLVFDEGANISAYEQDYFVIQRAGFSHVMQFTGFTPSTSELTFSDESGNSITTSNTSATNANLIVDGNTYAVRIVNDTRKVVHIDLDADGALSGTAAASYTNMANATVGAEYSFLVPKLITSGQGGLYFYKGQQTLKQASAAGAVVGAGLFGFNLTNSSVSAGKLQVGATEIGALVNGTINNVTGTLNSGYIDMVVNCDAGFICNVSVGNSATGELTAPGFVLVEETLQGGTEHNWIYLPVGWDGTNTRTAVNTTRSDAANYTETGIVGTSTQYMGMSNYGTLVERLSSNLGGSATIKYPDIFLFTNMYVLTPTGTITSGATAGGTVTTETVLEITADVVKLDSEVTSSDKTSKDLILVGGPCINSLVAELAADGSFPYGCADWPGRDFGRVQLVADAFASGQTALVIAGTRAADTDLAARLVQNGLQGATSTQLAGSSIEVTGSVSSPAYS
jgi:hypothetical protein